MHYGVKGMKWGVRRTREELGYKKRLVRYPKPEQPVYKSRYAKSERKKGLDSKKALAKSKKPVRVNEEFLDEEIRRGRIKLKINIGHQRKHLAATRTDPGRSYILGDLATAQRLINKLSGTGQLVVNKNGWTRKERVFASEEVGVYVRKDGTEIRTNKLIITYSKKGTHIYTGQEE